MVYEGNKYTYDSLYGADYTGVSVLGMLVMKYKLVIFDMDGTVLDTLRDLTDSVNYILEKHNMPTHDIEKIKYFVGNGIHKLIERAVLPDTDSELLEYIYEEFLVYYKEHCHIKTAPYDGIPELIKELRKKGYLTAIATNKSDSALRELLEVYFKDLFDCAIGVKEGVNIKPAKDMVEYILKELNCTKAEAVYVGDSDVDLLTAANSGIDCIAVSWGFRGREFLIKHGAKIIADTPLEVIEYV